MTTPKKDEPSAPRAAEEEELLTVPYEEPQRSSSEGDILDGSAKGALIGGFVGGAGGAVVGGLLGLTGGALREGGKKKRSRWY